MDAIRIARAFTGREQVMKIFGSYHGHHDYVMVSLGIADWGDIGERDNYKSVTYGAGIPKAVIDMTAAVPFNDAPMMEARIQHLIDEGRKPACVIMEAAMMNLGVVLPEPGYLRGGSRHHQEARHRAHLRRGQDRHLHGGRRRRRALRRGARHGHAGQGPGGRSAVRGHRRVGRGHERGGERQGLPGGHLQRQPAVHGRGPGQPGRRS